MVWTSTVFIPPWSGGSIEAALMPCVCSSVRWTFLPLPLCITDCETESHRPRGAVGFLFLELSVLYAYSLRGGISPLATAPFRRVPAMVSAILSVAQ